MSLFSLKDVRNHPRRSAFDLSSKVAFSAKSGELLPIKWYFTMPGDKFALKRGNNREIYERGGENSQDLPLRTKRIRSERRSTACSGTSTVYLKLAYPNNLLNRDLFFVNEKSVKTLGRDTMILRYPDT